MTTIKTYMYLLLHYHWALTYMWTTDYPGKMCSFYREDAITWSFNEFKLVLAVPMHEILFTYNTD